MSGLSLNDTRRRMLAAISAAPRTVLHFSSSDYPGTLSPRIAQTYCDALVEAGYITPGPDGYAITSDGAAALAECVASSADPRSFHSRGTYDGAELRPFAGREGALDALAVPRRGIDAGRRN